MKNGKLISDVFHFPLFVSKLLLLACRLFSVRLFSVGFSTRSRTRVGSTFRCRTRGSARRHLGTRLTLTHLLKLLVTDLRYSKVIGYRDVIRRDYVVDELFLFLGLQLVAN